MSELNKDEFDKLIKDFSKETEEYNIFSSLLYKPMKIEMPDPDPDNTQFRFMSRMWGIPVYTSNHMPVETVVKVRGIPSSRKPNSRRPFYRKVTIKKPVIYAVKGMGIISPPGYLASFV